MEARSAPLIFLKLFLIYLTVQTRDHTSAWARSSKGHSKYTSHTGEEMKSVCKETAKRVKAIKTVLPATPKHWVGDGFNVHPVFSHLAFSKAVSPFLMFDYGAPKRFSPTRKRRGVGQHPHRGFETVTVAFQGEVEHADSVGNRGVIGEGDVQWMTAARGIIHEEYHSEKFAREGGILEMCQLWVNLPAKFKMDPPRYQPILKKDIPTVAPSPTCEVRIIAGELSGKKGPAKTFTPVNMWDIKCSDRGSKVSLPIPTGHNTILFIRRGGIAIGEETLGPQQVAILDMEGGDLEFKATSDNTSVLLLGGEPIDEPIAARGPFVMNTHKELAEAQRDYYSGNFGQ